MKIRNEQMERLAQEQQPKAQPAAKTAFGDVLAEELGTGKAQAQVPAAGLDALSRLNACRPAEESTESRLMRTMDHMLSDFESYAETLGTGDKTDLKSSYALLEKISASMRELRKDTPQINQDNPGLGSMVDELEVLTVTETFKFNRGDYS